jgi:hypothetical protein
MKTCLVEVVGCQTWPSYSLHNKAVTCWHSTAFLYQQVERSCIPYESKPVPQHSHCKQWYCYTVLWQYSMSELSIPDFLLVQRITQVILSVSLQNASFV